MKMNNKYLLACLSHKIAVTGAVLVVTCIVLLAGCGMNMKETSGTNLSQKVAPDVPVPGMTIITGVEPTPTVDAGRALPLVESVISPTWEEIRDREAQLDRGWDNYRESLKGTHVQGWTGSIMQIYYHRDKDGVKIMHLDMDGPNDADGHFYDAHVFLIFTNKTEARQWELGQQVTIDGEILSVTYDGSVYLQDPNITLVVGNN